ncbi:MAG: U32 family peptidase [Nanohaloarchaea archaeon]|nr:U32 family peptidase [Candidatus Nanohaloarchaea archaeon]
MSKKPELLVPIKNLAGLKACENYADAVYFSCGKLNMRSRNKDITLRNIKSIVSSVHKAGLKAYLTVNAIIYNNDIKVAEDVVKKAKDAQVDAIITWDPAVIALCKENEVPFHVSTQANISNWKTAEFYRDMGAERVILAREMNLNHIAQIKKKVDVEIETFVHGAMCVSVSGRCYLSSYLYGMSANCGACAQPCRKEWMLVDSEKNEIVCDGKYLMSAKDICMIDHVPELLKAGIDSFKIEGRLRDEKYIETVSRCYREAIDACHLGTYTKDKVVGWKTELSKVYNRGFSTGFYFATPTRDGFNYDYSDNMAKEKRRAVGVVKHYYLKPGVAVIALNNSGLKVGDKLMVAGKTTYFRQDAGSIFVDDVRVEKAKKGTLIGLKVDERVRENDVVYRIVDA